MSIVHFISSYLRDRLSKPAEPAVVDSADIFQEPNHTTIMPLNGPQTGPRLTTTCMQKKHRRSQKFREKIVTHIRTSKGATILSISYSMTKIGLLPFPSDDYTFFNSCTRANTWRRQANAVVHVVKSTTRDPRCHFRVTVALLYRIDMNQRHSVSCGSAV